MLHPCHFFFGGIKHPCHNFNLSVSGFVMSYDFPLIYYYHSSNKCINFLNDLLQDNAEKFIYSAKGSSLERVLTFVICHIGQKPCICSHTAPRYSFSSQILTIPFLWDVFPNLRQVCCPNSIWQVFFFFFFLCDKWKLKRGINHQGCVFVLTILRGNKYQERCYIVQEIYKLNVETLDDEIH